MQPDEAEPAGGQHPPTQIRLPIGVAAPGAARGEVGRCLRGRVGDAALSGAQLLASELVTNSVRHSGGTATESILVRVGVTARTIRLEVDDPGDGLGIVRREPDREAGGGFGLNLVASLSERWGREHIAGGGTRMWAELDWGEAG
jgi:signal transduction histidine kinase